MSDAYAVIGNPIGHTKSPLIHGLFAEATGQDMVYTAIEGRIGQFAADMDTFRAAGGRGMNVTAPFKLDAFACATERSPRAQGRVLMAHLGNGASLCAARAGRSVATTMGFSALDGLMMGTRSGTLDAGVLLYLMEQGWDHDRIQKLLYKQSGLLGVSGISADMRRLRADGSPAAQRAIDQFTYRVVRESGAMAASNIVVISILRLPVNA